MPGMLRGPFFAFFFAGPCECFARTGVVGDDGRFEFAFGEDFGFFCTAGGVVMIVDGLFVLALAGYLSVHVVAAGEFVASGVSCRQRCRVPERFVGDACVGQSVRGVVGVSFYAAAFGCAFASAAWFAGREARAVGFFVVGVDTRHAAFAGGFFLGLGQPPNLVVGVALFGEGACLQECFAVDRWHDGVAEPCFRAFWQVAGRRSWGRPRGLTSAGRERGSRCTPAEEAKPLTVTEFDERGRGVRVCVDEGR